MACPLAFWHNKRLSKNTNNLNVREQKRPSLVELFNKVKLATILLVSISRVRLGNPFETYMLK